MCPHTFWTLNTIMVRSKEKLTDFSNWPSSSTDEDVGWSQYEDIDFKIKGDSEFEDKTYFI